MQHFPSPLFYMTNKQKILCVTIWPTCTVWWTWAQKNFYALNHFLRIGSFSFICCGSQRRRKPHICLNVAYLPPTSKALQLTSECYFSCHSCFHISPSQTLLVLSVQLSDLADWSAANFQLSISSSMWHHKWPWHHWWLLKVTHNTHLLL